MYTNIWTTNWTRCSREMPTHLTTVYCPNFYHAKSFGSLKKYMYRQECICILSSLLPRSSSAFGISQLSSLECFAIIVVCTALALKAHAHCHTVMYAVFTTCRAATIPVFLNCSTGAHPKGSMKRKIWTEIQLEILNKSYQANSYPKKEDINELAKSFNACRKRIESWFAFRRYKETRKGKLPVGEWYLIIHTCILCAYPYVCAISEVPWTRLWESSYTSVESFARTDSRVGLTTRELNHNLYVISFAANRGIMDPVTKGSLQPLVEVVHFSIQTRNGHKRNPRTLAIWTLCKKCVVVIQVL